MTTFIYKFTNSKIETTANDVLIRIVSYVADSGNFPFLDQFNAIDTFDVNTVKTALPASGFESFLAIMTNKALGEKYNKTDIGATAVSGNPVITEVSDTDGLVPGLFVLGDNIPVDTTVVSVRDTTSVRLSAAPTTTGPLTLKFTTSGWDIDYSEIDRLTDIIDFTAI